MSRILRWETALAVSSYPTTDTAKQKRFYAVDAATIDEMANWLARIGGFCNDRLDRLEQKLREDNRHGRKR